MVKGVVLILGVVCFTFCGCKNDQLSTEIEKIVKEWTGKKIIFPQDVFCKSIDRVGLVMKKLIGRMGVLLQPIIAISVVLVLIVTDVIRVLLR